METRARSGSTTVLGLAIVGLLSALAPLLGRDLAPDMWVEARHLQAAESFAREGFLAHRMTPYTQLSPLAETPPAYRIYYTRTTQLSFLLFGWLDGIGIDRREVWRACAALLTAAGVLAYHALLRAAGVPGRTCAWAALVLAWSPALATWGHSFALVYSAMPVLTFGSLALWLRLRRGPPRLGPALALWLLLFVQALATQHTYMMTTQLFFWIWALLERDWSWRRAVLWLTPHVAALALIVLKNAWLLGGLGPALIDDLVAKVWWRMTNVSVHHGAASASLPFAWEQLAAILWKHFRWSGGLLALLGGLAILAFRIPGPRGAFSKPVRRTLAALLLPAVVYWMLFFQEAYVHSLHARNLMAGFALVAALLGVHLVAAAARAGGFRRAAIVTLCALVLAGQLVYTHRQAAERPPWAADARRLSAELARESSLVLCAYTDEYPLQYLLGRPLVFPRAADQTLSTHPWWLLTDADEVEELGRTVDALWPGRTVGLVVRTDRPLASPLRRSVEARGWRPRWSAGGIAVYVVPDIGAELSALRSSSSRDRYSAD